MAYRRPKKRRTGSRAKTTRRRSYSSRRSGNRRSVAGSRSNTVRVVIEQRSPAATTPEELATSMLAKSPKRSRF